MLETRTDEWVQEKQQKDLNAKTVSQHNLFNLAVSLQVRTTPLICNGSETRQDFVMGSN